jgi:hypothetical protein
MVITNEVQLTIVREAINDLEQKWRFVEIDPDFVNKEQKKFVLAQIKELKKSLNLAPNTSKNE